MGNASRRCHHDSLCLISHFRDCLDFGRPNPRRGPAAARCRPDRAVADHRPAWHGGAAHPLAVQIGLDVLKNGGNAVDAAIAVNAALGVMEPMSCGIGGDLFAIVWDAKTQKLYGLNASGRSPYAATRSNSPNAV